MTPASASVSTDEERLFYAELIRYEASRGYRPGWTRRTFAARFGGEPPLEWATDAPATLIRPQTLVWIRARSAAFARSQTVRNRG